MNDNNPKNGFGGWQRTSHKLEASIYTDYRKKQISLMPYSLHGSDGKGR